MDSPSVSWHLLKNLKECFIHLKAMSVLKNSLYTNDCLRGCKVFVLLLDWKEEMNDGRTQVTKCFDS